MLVDHLFLETVRENLFSCSRKLLAEFSSLQFQDRGLCFLTEFSQLRSVSSFRRHNVSLLITLVFHVLSCWPTLLPLSSSFKDHVNRLSSLRWIQDNFPISTLITSASLFFHLSWHISRFLGSGHEHYWGIVILYTTEK